MQRKQSSNISVEYGVERSRGYVKRIFLVCCVLILCACVFCTQESFALAPRAHLTVEDIAEKKTALANGITIAVPTALDRENIEQYHELMYRSNAFDHNWVERIIGTIKREDSVTYVAKQGETIVGYVTGAEPGRSDKAKYIQYEQYPDSHYLVGIAVHPSYGKKGIGKGLIDAYFNAVAQLGYPYIALHVSHSTSKSFRNLVKSYFWDRIIDTSGYSKRGNVWIIALPDSSTKVHDTSFLMSA